MHRSPSRCFAQLLTVALAAQLIVAPVWATCGGGGGGGTGGITSSAPQVYHVPWVTVGGVAPPAGDLVVYWFPTSKEQVKGSALRTSRSLTLWSAQCVGVGMVPAENNALRQRFAVNGTPTAVLAGSDGKEIGRVEAADGQLNATPVEKLVRSELEKREDQVKQALKQAKAKNKSGDQDAAAELYGEVFQHACLFPSSGKKAAKALKKMGRKVEIAGLDLDAPDFPRPDLGRRTSAKMERFMEAGLAAERIEDLARAQRLYEKAQSLDPADPVVLRFLGELHRHHTGDWQLARQIFSQLLARPADSLSRAVALHGLGKMTIHSGKFEDGVALFERSIDSYPLALAYRNLAVFWNSEKETEKAWSYTQKALALEPEDAYNQVFAATYFVTLGKADEARQMAEEHHDLMPASYNLAAIYAQLGERDKAFEMLRRHFYDYEQHDAVRAKEMREARDDIVFTSYHQDADFISLTALADSNQDSYHWNGVAAGLD